MNEIDKLTMEYMSNRAYNEAIHKQNNVSDKTDNLVEERFYKKRLINMYKQMFKDDGSDKILDVSVMDFFHRFNINS